MMALSFEVDGCPVKRRVRMSRNGHPYTDERTQVDMGRVRAAYAAAGGVRLEGPVRLTVDVFGALPKCTPRATESRPATHRPDVDNVLKAVMDGLNGAAYADDRQVVEVRATKHPDRRREAHVMVTVEEIGTEEET